jgi:hypothetical protein
MLNVDTALNVLKKLLRLMAESSTLADIFIIAFESQSFENTSVTSHIMFSCSGF